MSSARVIVHRASPSPGIGSSEHERSDWVEPGRSQGSVYGRVALLVSGGLLDT
jgi:hypothetical protein